MPPFLLAANYQLQSLGAAAEELQKRLYSPMNTAQRALLAYSGEAASRTDRWTPHLHCSDGLGCKESATHGTALARLSWETLASPHATPPNPASVQNPFQRTNLPDCGEKQSFRPLTLHPHVSAAGPRLLLGPPAAPASW
ncbi:unnamed protein product [Caretta caretta]